jgi:cytochrome c oxidase subunit 2
MKKIIVAIMALTVIFTIAACSKKESAAPSATPTPTASVKPSTSPAATTPATTTPAATPAATTPAATPASGSAKELKITATNWKFDQAEYKVKAGETYKVTLNSTDGAHGLKATGIDLTVGTNKSVDFKFDKAGTYDIQCNIPCGTDHLKMKAKIVVE